ncbi:phospho-N-acetylmuramoyl-pentapeptide-transferase [Prosthecobacter fusiformis]|uniref:Phospho-N-acetylmuramoyl-pentapeptide-transferase n=1 Tax=Prosthecobacter fusiformis TaxID=48464 RepID=A0A4R7RLB7_9BACT|nr:phospho-N-acetylmuramoyl-pentapeptide-transferase [Prosthecobacter fusiformis]TDU64243.1 phospho-N-acetylmuramoyl-pentapeptide-transferase [Prosthecobacter fusiformis]
MMYWLYELRTWLEAADWISDDSALYKLLNIFRYHTFRAGGAFITAFVMSLLFGEKLIRKLISLKIGQPIRTAEEVHQLYELHGKKAGTPTMGGILILACIVVTTLLWAKWDNVMVWTILFTTVGLGALGFWDDYLKISKKNSKGVSARTKLVWQGGVAVIAGFLMAYAVPPDEGVTLRALYVPFFKDAIITDMGIFSVALFTLIIVGASNAVNLTDGLDGLATGCSLTTALAYAGFGYVCGNANYSSYLGVAHHTLANELPIVAMALAGACVGFLWFNAHPARMFMGDTGSLALGGCIATLAIGCKQEIVLALVGGVFVMEAMSVIIQVFSFKTRGKRVFRMSPIHHHFELGGWHENQVIVRFWVLSLFFALLGLATLKLR